jgi:hypothetical protein
MRELAQEVVLDHPQAVIAEPVRELRLRDHLMKRIRLAARRPRPWHGDFVKQAELHGKAVTLLGC